MRTDALFSLSVVRTFLSLSDSRLMDAVVVLLLQHPQVILDLRGDIPSTEVTSKGIYIIILWYECERAEK